MVKIEEVMLVVVSIMLAIFVFACMEGAVDSTILLGDEVRTTDRYNEFFNDSFSGRVIGTGDMYTVRDENGTERTFERHWLDKVDAEEVV